MSDSHVNHAIVGESFQSRLLAAAYETQCLPDEAICERLRAGDEMALRVLIDRHARMVRRLAMNILSDRGDAEDVAQDVFVSVWKNRDKWVRGEAKFTTWLHRVTINKAIDRRRRRQATPEPIEFITAVADALVADDTPAQDHDLQKRDEVEALKEEMKRLPKNQGLALQMFYLQEREVVSIAASMGLTELAVRSLLKRGRQALKLRMERRKKIRGNVFIGTKADH
jgi:RNA polymerase sigma-70 factor (ECF subfamily)